jgi:hypothetical protein
LEVLGPAIHLTSSGQQPGVGVECGTLSLGCHGVFKVRWRCAVGDKMCREGERSFQDFGFERWRFESATPSIPHYLGNFPKPQTR